MVDKREEVTLARTHRSLQMRNMEHQASHKTLADIKEAITSGDNRREITLEDNKMVTTLGASRVVTTLVKILLSQQMLDMEHLVKVRHKTLEDIRVTTILASKEVTTLEVNKAVIISEVKIADSQLKEFNLDRTVQEILLLVTKISVNLSIQKML